MPLTTSAALWTTRLLARATTSEGMLGLTGCAIACASGSFALYMNMHGPAQRPATASYFTVFAQLNQGGRAAQSAAGVKPGVLADDVDPIVTGSIPSRGAGLSRGRPILENMLLRQIDGDNALVEVNENLAVYKIGDLIPGAGRLVAMTRQGGRPALETSKGLIVEQR